MDLDVDYSLPHETIVDDSTFWDQPLDKDIDLSPPHEEALIQEGDLLMDDIFIHDGDSFSKIDSPYANIFCKKR